MNNRKKPLFFDIEAGGLSGQKSSIYSISYSQGEKTRSLYAKPDPGTFISSWSSKNVWEPIKKMGAPISTEKKALSSFLSTLESQKGGIIAGWNIGYTAVPQADIYGTGPTGFDIPMIMTRAGKYPGMRERYQKAFQNVQIRDIGVEYSYKLARGLQAYPHLIDEKLYGQVEGYMKQANRYLAEKPGASVPEVAKHLGSSGYRFSGWKQETVYSLMNPGKKYAAHQSETDVSAVRELARANLNITPEFATAWNREALKNTLVSTLVSGNKTPVAYQEALNRAGKFGITDYFESSLADEVRSRGGNLDLVRAGHGIQDKYSVIRGSRIASIAEGVQSAISGLGRGIFAGAPGGAFGLGEKIDLLAGFAGKHKGKLGFAALALGLYATKPLSLFNSKDDDHNTVIGLSHKGESGANRKYRTDFGSGYQGDKSHEREVKDRFKLLTHNLKKYGTTAGTGHKRLLIPKAKLGSEQDIEKILGFVPVALAIPEAGQDTLVSYRHPTMNYHIHSHGEDWTIHEDRHAALTMKLRAWMDRRGQQAKQIHSSIMSPIKGFIGGVAHIFEEGMPGAYYYLKGQLTGAEDMAHRLQREMKPGYRKFVRGLSDVEPKSLFNRVKKTIISGRDDFYNTIEGLRHGGQAEKKRREMTDFGSGWIRKALSKGIDAARIASAASKLGTGVSNMEAAEFAGKLTKLLGKNPERAMKFVRGAQGVHMGGEHYVFGEVIGKGGFGTAIKSYSTSSRKIGTFKTISSQMKEALEKVTEESRFIGPATSARGGLKSGSRNLKTFIEGYSKGINQTWRKYGLTPGTLEYEAKMQTLARKQMGDIIPEVYGISEKGLMTEFAGSAIGENTREESLAMKWIKDKWSSSLSEPGSKIRHLDPQLGNVLRRGGRYRVIDFGVSAEMSALDTRELAGLQEVLSKKGLRRKRFIQAHQEGVKLAGQNTLRPGSRHTKQAGKMVTTNTVLLR